MAIRNTNDGTDNQPYLRTDINMGGVSTLPPTSSGPQGDQRQLLTAVKEAGYMGVQGGDPEICRELGLSFTGGGRINLPEEAEPLAARQKEMGHDASTCHVGWGMESDDEIFALVEAIIAASHKHDYPVYIETHRSTITQDMYRTVKICEKFPEVRFNGDFSHWYTGLEMVYGGFDNKLAFIAPVLERVRFLHGRIGNPGCMQVDIGDGTDRPYVDHFRQFWTQSFLGFLRSAQPGDYICFNPELLAANNYYARTFPDADGNLVEECDRWEQAKLYTRIARECFAAARDQLQA